MSKENSEFPMQRGTLHITISKIRNVPLLADGTHHPYILARIDEKDVKFSSSLIASNIWGATDPATKQDDTHHHYAWTSHEVNEIEISYDPFHFKAPTLNVLPLTIEVWDDKFPLSTKFGTKHEDQVIGTGKIPMKELPVYKLEEESTGASLTLSIHDPVTEEYRGEVDLLVSFDLPLRKAYLFVSRFSRVFDYRDRILRTVLNVGSEVCKHFDTLVRKYRKIAIGLTLGILGILLGMGLISAMVMIPAFFVGLLTFPLWIVPVSIGVFFTAPIWIPILLLFVLAFMVFVTSSLGILFTSRKIRKSLSLHLHNAKKTATGRRLFYEKMETAVVKGD